MGRTLKSSGISSARSCLLSYGYSDSDARSAQFGDQALNIICSWAFAHDGSLRSHARPSPPLHRSFVRDGDETAAWDSSALTTFAQWQTSHVANEGFGQTTDFRMIGHERR